jgi:glycosyltransferase involved in cell wall biosynthesis
MGKHILFVSHDATRTGAPIVLLHLMRWIKQNTDINITILLRGGGELEDEFKAVSTTYIWFPANTHTTVWGGRFQRWTKKLSRHHKGILKVLKLAEIDLIYGNTAITSGLGIELKSCLDCPVICHIHELKMIIDQVVGRETFIDNSNQIDYFVAASEAVATNLVDNYHISSKKIGKVYEFIPTNVSAFQKDVQSVKDELSIPHNAFVVGGSGTLDWRKAPDIFVQIALHVRSIYNIPVYFVWIGGGGKNEFDNLFYDLEQTGLLPYVKFIGSKKDPLDYMQVFDVFALTSREDPYPLVCLEAASLAKPILCFNGSGGMPEFVGQDCGFVVPYLRPDIMAEKILYLIKNTIELENLGTAARDKVVAQHDVSVAGKQVINHIKDILAKSSNA